MTENFENHFDNLIKELRIAETNQREIHAAAIDIEDTDQANAVMLAARTKIWQIKKWSKELHRIRDEIVSYYDEYESKSDTTSQDEGELLYNHPEQVIGNDATEILSPEPSAVVLLGKTFAVNGWKDVFVKVCEAMILKRPYKFLVYFGVSNLNPENRSCFNFDVSQIEGESARLSNGLYVNTEGNSDDIYE